MKKIIFIFSLVLFTHTSCVELSAQDIDTTIVCKNYYKMMRKIDKSHPPFIRKLRALQNEERHFAVSKDIAENILKSDTIYIIICPFQVDYILGMGSWTEFDINDPESSSCSGGVEYTEYVCSNSATYCWALTIVGMYEAGKQQYAQILRRIQNGEYEECDSIPSHAANCEPSRYYYYKIVRKKDKCYSVSKREFYIHPSFDKLYMKRREL